MHSAVEDLFLFDLCIFINVGFFANCVSPFCCTKSFLKKKKKTAPLQMTFLGLGLKINLQGYMMMLE